MIRQTCHGQKTDIDVQLRDTHIFPTLKIQQFNNKATGLTSEVKVKRKQMVSQINPSFGLSLLYIYKKWSLYAASKNPSGRHQCLKRSVVYVSDCLRLLESLHSSFQASLTKYGLFDLCSCQTMVVSSYYKSRLQTSLQKQSWINQ